MKRYIHPPVHDSYSWLTAGRKVEGDVKYFALFRVVDAIQFVEKIPAEAVYLEADVVALLIIDAVVETHSACLFIVPRGRLGTQT